jgi:putative signal transducing protein
MGLIKIFSGSEILAQALQQKIEAIGIETIIKDNIQSARMGGFGSSDLAVEVFIQEKDYGKAHPVIEKFRLSI